MRALLLLLALLLWTTPALAGEARRFALVVGANAGALGRPPLRYAHQDARAFSEVLVQAGRFKSEDVQVLLDPRPKELLATLDAALGLAAAEPGGAMVLFYYSGHADETTLYPSGRKLALKEIRERLEGSDATLRIGILDACRGGGWTGAKGLSPTSSFEVDAPLQLQSEGSILLASSSGIEDANEAAVLGGSIFTHHLIAALRGGADLNEDGHVTVAEAFGYTRERTVRDSAVLTSAPQHPSFQVHLKGREDLPLTFLSLAPSVVQLTQKQGPIQLLDVAHGRHVVELPRGGRTTTVALPPGRYVALRQDRHRRFAHAFELQEGQRFELNEDALTPAENLAVASKGLHAHPWNVVSLEPIPLMGGRVVLGFERVLTPYFSGRVDLGFKPLTEGEGETQHPPAAAVDLGGRYYFFGRAPEALFVGGSMGLHYESVTQGEPGPRTNAIGLLEVGNTWLVAKRFVFTLAFGTTVTFPLSEAARPGVPADLGYVLAPQARVGVGAAF